MNDVLVLLFAEGAADAQPLVMPRLVPGDQEPLVAAVLDRARAVRRRVLPAPAPGRPAVARSWYRDLWWALPERDQRSIVAVAGPGAACLGLLLDRDARVVARVREPLHALEVLAAAGARLPNRAALLALRDEPERTLKPRLRAVANPQARELLVPWSEADELPVTIGPPSDADRWRELLFGEALPCMQSEASALPRNAANLPGRQPYHELLLALNWLDRELYEHHTP